MDDRRKNERIDAHQVGLQAVNGIDGETLGIVSNLSDLDRRPEIKLEQMNAR